MIISKICIAMETLHGFSVIKLTRHDIQYDNKNVHIMLVNKALWGN